MGEINRPQASTSLNEWRFFDRHVSSELQGGQFVINPLWSKSGLIRRCYEIADGVLRTLRFRCGKRTL